MKNNLSYEDFQKKLLELVSLELNQNGAYLCEITQAQKNNVMLTGLSIRQADSKVATVLYLESRYQDFLNGKPLEQISREMLTFYQNQEFPDFNPLNLTDYEKIKDMLRVRLVNRENNQSYYKQGPYRLHPMGAEVLYIELEGNMQTHVTNAMAEQWMIPKMELFHTALINTQDSQKPLFHSINEMICDLAGLTPDGDMEPQETIPMYVLSNEAKEYGATVILYPDMLKQIRRQIGDDYYILPSSIHECLILPKGQNMLDEMELRDMVRDVNQSQLKPEEVLGNEVFEFRDSTNKVRKCKKEDRER